MEKYYYRIEPKALNSFMEEIRRLGRDLSNEEWVDWIRAHNWREVSEDYLTPIKEENLS